MTKDEIKNKISMALKDPILQQGFEVICKDHAELEEAKELLLELYDCIPASMADLCRETLQKVALFFRDEE